MRNHSIRSKVEWCTFVAGQKETAANTEKILVGPRTYAALAMGAVVAGTLLIFTYACFGQEIPAAAKTPDSQQRVEELLRWKFKVGDIIRGKQHVTTTIVGDDNSHYRNLQIYEFLWTVREATADGEATVDVRFERIQVHNEFPRLEFDSQRDDPTIEPAEPPELKTRMYGLRAMCNSQFTITVTARGAVALISGAEAVLGARAYTPGDLPALPEKAVKIGDVWSVDIGDSETGMTGRATYQLVGSQADGTHRVVRIEGRSKFTEQAGILPGDNQLGVNVSVSQFDPRSGRFLDEKSASESRVQVAPGRFFKVKLEATRRLVDAGADLAANPKSGEYLIALSGNAVHYAQVAGVDRPHAADKPFNADQLLYMTFYHRWEDANQDKHPDVEELSGLTTRFAEDEKINFQVTTVGMQNAKLHFDIVNNQGEKLGTNRIPIPRGPAAFAIRNLSNAQAGVYHFQFYVNDRYLIRVPVQVFPSASPAKSEPAAEVRPKVLD